MGNGRRNNGTQSLTMLILSLYIACFILLLVIYKFVVKHFTPTDKQNKINTVTFGDESAVKPNRTASILSILTLFFIWGAFTGSSLSPVHAPGPFTGDTSFSYTAKNANNQIDTAQVFIRVNPADEPLTTPSPANNNTNIFTKNDTADVSAYRSVLIRVKNNDSGGKDKAYAITKINGQIIKPKQIIKVDHGEISLSTKGSLSFKPDKGWQMEAIWLPTPEAVFTRLIEIAQNGYQNVSLFENIGWSLIRVIAGFLLGCIVGIPLGYAMGLSSWFRGWFDPIVEFMRPIPPLALIPLVIIWFGIWESGKISLLFLAALWIMTIAARAGVSGVNISKIHAAYSLGASKIQILIHVIIPNSLPEIFTGARVAMGVCWGTVVAAELVAAEKGAGKMIIAASKFQQTDIVIMGIILIGVIGYAIDMLMRIAEKKLVPWKGNS
jgi:taurine transport system permease protein